MNARLASTTLCSSPPEYSCFLLYSLANYIATPNDAIATPILFFVKLTHQRRDSRQGQVLGLLRQLAVDPQVLQHHMK